MPLIKEITYDFSENAFLQPSADGTSRRVTESQFINLSRTKGARAALAGATTLKRAAFTNTLVQAASDEGRRRILAQIAQQLHTELAVRVGFRLE